MNKNITGDGMPPANQVSRRDIARLAYINWKQDGCPHGRDLDYWLAAERDVTALAQLLATEQIPSLVSGQKEPGLQKGMQSGVHPEAQR